jgi:hypothetical protein
MRTEDLIKTLAADAAAVRPVRIAGPLVAAALIAIAVWAALMAAGLHLAPALSAGARWFWMKSGYCFVLATAGLIATTRLAKPGGRVGVAALIALAAVGAVGMMAVRDTLAAAPGAMAALWLGHTWSVCPGIIVVAAAPTFVATFWWLRRTAPTRLTLAGAGAGLFAGAVGALTWALYCQETTAAFVFGWYSLGIVLCTAIGALLGPRLLRW